MKGQKTLFSRASDEWETPGTLFKQLDQEFHFDLDAAATKENALAPGYFTKEDDALKQDWYVDYGEDGIINTIFLNPPYSMIAKFMKKAYESALEGATVVCLIPARTDTRYFQDYCMKASEIRLIRGRLKFANPTIEKTTSATFPSCVIVFDERMTHKSTPYPSLYAMEQPKERGIT
jgi:phage N-6-adenine-methyltransferase